MYLNYTINMNKECEIKFNCILNNPRITHVMILAEANVINRQVVRINADILQTNEFQNYIDEILFNNSSNNSLNYEHNNSSITNKIFIEKHLNIICKQNISRMRIWLSDSNNSPIELPNNIQLMFSIKCD